MEYKSFDKYIIRQSRFMIREYLEQINDKKINDKLIDLLCNNSLFREAILCASQDLYFSIERYLEGKINDKRKLRDFQISILQYWGRMCARSTPFGLFASVSIGNSSIHPPNQYLRDYRAYIEADCEWIYSLIKKIELRNYKKLYFSCNNAIYKIGKKLCVPYVLGAKVPEQIMFEETAQITQIINLCKNKSVSFYDLSANVVNKQFAKDLNFERVFEFLVQNDVLISHLRPSPKSESMIKDMATRLKDANIEKDILIRIESLSIKFEQYNNHDVAEGAEELLRDIICEMRSINNTKNVVKIDLISVNENNLLDKKDFLILEEFANVFIESLFNLKSSYLLYDEYKDLFYGKYGEYREIPLVEMLDDTIGIGVPNSYREAKKKETWIQIIST